MKGRLVYIVMLGWALMGLALLINCLPGMVDAQWPQADRLLSLLMAAMALCQLYGMFYSPVVYFSQPRRRRESAWAAALSWAWCVLMVCAMWGGQS